MVHNIARLRADLKSGDLCLQRAAAQAFLAMGEQARVAAVELVRAAGDEDETIREWCMSTLEELGPPDTSAVEELSQCLAHGNPDVGYWAATLLGRLESAAAPAVPALIVATGDDKPLAVRQRAVWALGQIGSAAVQALPALQQADSDADPRLSRLATEAIDRISG